MTNIVNFPDRRRVEVSMCNDKESGNPEYAFELVEGELRVAISVCTSLTACARLANELTEEGMEVIWDEPTRRHLFVNSGGAS